jgi:putative nucleotidyltransferase with HDIG domain
LFAFTIAYYGINTWGITLAISLERSLAPFRVWRENFIWIALNYFGGASVAALLVSYTKNLDDYTYLIIIVPLLVVLYFTFSTSMGRVEDANRHLSQLNSLYMATIETLAMAIDAKDQITHGHIRRVQTYAVALARSVGVTDEAQIRAIEAAALLHDMGKLAVPEYILNKPGPLTPAEFEKMKLHASAGADILSAIDFPYPVVPIVRHHHENWDGSGYPSGLKGAEIPVGARILSVVDCFDALTSDRPYRPRLSDKEAIRILLDRRGRMYDPLMVDTFVRVHTIIAPSTQDEIHNPPLRAIAAASTAVQELPESRNARFEEIAASSDEMLTLFDLARSLTGTMGVQDATDLIAKHLRRLVPSSACVFYLYDEPTDELIAAHASGEHAALIRGLRIPTGQRLSGWVAANRQTIRNSDPVLDLGESARAMAPRPRSCLSTPLLSGNSLVGVLSLYSSNKDVYTEEHQRLAEAIARQVSPIIGEARAAEEQRARTFTDESTGLPNLLHLRDFIRPYLEVRGSEQPVSVLVVGSSNGSPFKPVLVNAIRRSLRGADLLFSTGPDELTAVLLNTSRDTAAMVARNLSSALANLGTESGSFTTRIGIASCPNDSSDPDQLLGQARKQSRGIESVPPEAIH